MSPYIAAGLVGSPVCIPCGVLGQLCRIVVVVQILKIKVVSGAAAAVCNGSAECRCHIRDLVSAPDFGITHGIIFPVKEYRKTDLIGTDGPQAELCFFNGLLPCARITEPVDTNRKAGCLGVFDILVEVLVYSALTISCADDNRCDTGSPDLLEIDRTLMLGNINADYLVFELTVACGNGSSLLSGSHCLSGGLLSGYSARRG